MTDCPNGAMRDLLPDLLHDRLSPVERREVEAHLASCADCRAELALLGDLRASLRQAPVVDVARIAASVPAYRPVVARRAWMGQRAAAAVALLVAGGAAAALLSRGTATIPERAPVVATAPSMVSPIAPLSPPRVIVDSAPLVVAGSQPVRAHDSAAMAVAIAPVRGGRAIPAPTRELAVGSASMGDLTTRELDALVRDIESIDAVPSTEVEGAATITPSRGRS